jgi:tRNA-Thr(GGU) m(6)t(6)A37 methyltransferase TsaA
VDLTLKPVGFVRSPLRDRRDAPRGRGDGAPEAVLELDADVADALRGVEPGTELLLVTWLHEAERDVLLVHPRGDESRPLTGVFATRSPDRPNPLGLHRVTVLAVEGTRLRVDALEAIDGTPVLDLKIA